MNNQETTTKLKALRGDRSAREVADAIGITEATLLAYERGDQAPRAEVKIRIARLYDVPVDAIFNSEDYEGDNEMAKIEKNLDSESVIRDFDDRFVFPLIYLQEAMVHAATEAVEKYEFESNNDAFGLACLLQVFAGQIKAINGNSEKVIGTVTDIVKRAGGIT